MSEVEDLREEVVALQQASRREHTLRIEADRLIGGLRMLGGNDAEAAIQGVLASVAEVVSSRFSMVLAAMDGDNLTTVATSTGEAVPGRWPIGPLFRRVCQGRASAVFDVSVVAEWQAHGACPDDAGSAVLAPLRGEPSPAILVCTHPGPGRFGPAHANMVGRFAPLVAQALASLEIRRTLAHEHAFLVAVSQTVDALVVVLDPAGRIVEFNATSERLSGYRREEVIGRFPWEFLVPPDATDGVRVVIDELMAGSLRVVHENPWIRRDGAQRLIAWTSTTIAGSDGGIGYVVATGIDITDRRALEERLRRTALHDSLTDLLNRPAFRERVDQAIARGQRWTDYGFGILYIDLDGFKAVNDGLGHDAGDAVLVEVASRLVAAVRRNDIVARIGGDEFAVLLDGMLTLDDATFVIDRIRAVVGKPIETSLQAVCVGASIGTVLCGGGRRTADELLTAADEAMYLDKRQRKRVDPN